MVTYVKDLYANPYSFDFRIPANKYVNYSGNINPDPVAGNVEFGWSWQEETSITFNWVLPKKDFIPENALIAILGSTKNQSGINISVAKASDPNDFQIINSQPISNDSEWWEFFELPNISNYLIDSDKYGDPSNSYSVISIKVSGAYGCTYYDVSELIFRFDVDTSNQYFINYYESILSYHTLKKFSQAIKELDICYDTDRASKAFKQYVRWVGLLAWELYQLEPFGGSSNIKDALMQIFNASKLLSSDIFNLEFIDDLLCYDTIKGSYNGPQPSRLQIVLLNLSVKFRNWADDWCSIGYGGDLKAANQTGKDILQLLTGDISIYYHCFSPKSVDDFDILGHLVFWDEWWGVVKKHVEENSLCQDPTVLKNSLHLSVSAISYGEHLRTVLENFKIIVQEKIIQKFYVAPPPIGNDNNNGITKSSPFATIQHAINFAHGSEKIPATVYIAAGTYFENLDMDDWESLNGGWNSDFSQRWDFKNDGLEPTDEFKSIIDGGGDGSCVHVGDDGGIASCIRIFNLYNVKIDGLTIQNGVKGNGGGIWISGSSPIISNATFRGHSASSGGAIWNIGSNSIITNSVFYENCAVFGGAIGIYSEPAPSLQKSRFYNNSASIGGSIFINSSSPTITNSIFYNNEADWGGGISTRDAFSEIVNCTFWQNIANSSGSAIDDFCNGDDSPIGGGACSGLGEPSMLVNSIFWENYGRDIYYYPVRTSVTYSNIGGWTSGTGNIFQDPMFFDSANLDFRLLPQSPSIDTGDNTQVLSSTDIVGKPRILDGKNDNNAVVDMGPFEATPGDLNGDFNVDYNDYIIFRTTYGSCKGGINFLIDSDFDGDGCITINDYRILRTLM
jgi:hypothetical protein